MKKYFYLVSAVLIMTMIMVGCNNKSMESEISSDIESPVLQPDDIPATMDDCYKALDQLLDADQKEDIKKTENADELYVYHFSLGLWIRNNWIYPTDARIARVFLDLGFNHPDDMSQEIIRGYYYYLNDMPYEIGQSD